MADLKETIESQLKDSSRVLKETAGHAELIARMGERLIAAYKNGGKILSFGNGGSACDAQNFADELVGRYERNRPPLPELALTTNTSDLTSIANDFGFEMVFERQLRAHARTGDAVAVAAYLGGSPVCDEAVHAFAESYADQNERDYAALREAVAAGRIASEEGL